MAKFLTMPKGSKGKSLWRQGWSLPKLKQRLSKAPSKIKDNFKQATQHAKENYKEAAVNAKKSYKVTMDGYK